MVFARGDCDIDPDSGRRFEHPDLGRVATRLAGARRVELGCRAGRRRASEQPEHRVCGDHGLQVDIPFQIDRTDRRPDPDGAHPILGQRAGLVRADDTRRAQRFDRAQTLDKRPSSRQARHAHRQREGDRRQKSLGHVGHDQADREAHCIFEGQPCDKPTKREERETDDEGNDRDQPCDAADFSLKRAGVDPDALRQRGDPPQLGVHAGGDDERAGDSSDACRAAEDEFTRVEQRTGGVRELGRAEHRLRLARHRRQIDIDCPIEQPGVRRDPIALLDQEHVAGHKRAGVDLLPTTVPEYVGLLGEVAPKGFDGLLCLALLDEGEEGVEQHDRHDRDCERGRTADQREHSGHPEQQRKRVYELLRELPWPARTPASRQLVGSVCDEPPISLAACKTLGAGAKIAQQSFDRFARIHVDAVARIRLHPAPRPPS